MKLVQEPRFISCSEIDSKQDWAYTKCLSMSSKDISASVYLGNTCEEFIKIYVYKFIGTENIKNPLRKKVSNLSLLKSWQLD